MSSDESGERRTNAVEYRSYLPEEPLEQGDPETFTELYGRLRGHFKYHQDRYSAYQRWLSQARIGTTYDRYLTRTVVLGSVAAIVGATTAIFAIGLHVLLNGGAGFSLGIGVTTVVLAGLLSGGALAGGHLLYPRFLSYRRGRRIDGNLLHATIFLRALSQSGRNPTTLIRELAGLESVYGDIALEFGVIRKDIELYNDSLLTAIQNTRSLTPSDRLHEFLDDLTSVIESGGDVEEFLDQKAGEQVQETRDNLEELVNALVTLAEAYVSLIFVGPILLISVLIVTGITGGTVVDSLFLLTYVGIPFGILVSVVAIHQLSKPYRIATNATVEREKPESRPPETAEPWFREYTKKTSRQQYLRPFRNPLTTLRRNPLYSLGVTAPVALGFVVLAIAFGPLEPSWERYLTAPVRFTTGFVVIPMFIMAVPLMSFHESKRRRQRAIESRFPGVLYTLASSNKRGMKFVDGVELVSRRYDDPIASEFRTVYRDIQLDNDVVQALSFFADRLEIPRLTMSVSVIRELVTTTDDLSVPLRSLANDLETRLSLQQTRKREMATYTIVVILGTLMYLVIIIAFDSFFIPRMTGLTIQESGLFPGEPPVTLYRTILFHSALIQAFGNGLLLGMLTDDSLCSGLKYSNALVAVVVFTFFLVP